MRNLPRRPKKYEMEGLRKKRKEHVEAQQALHVLSGQGLCDYCQGKSRVKELKIGERHYHFVIACPMCINGVPREIPND